MPSPRALRHPLTPLVTVIVVLPLVILLAPSPMRAGLLLLVFLLLSPVAAFLAVRALRGALARIPVPPDSGPSPREATLERWLKTLLVVVPVVGTASIALAALGVRSWRAPPPPGQPPLDWGFSAPASIFLAAVPLLFTLLGVRLWRDLAADRRRRVAGQASVPPEPASATGDPGLDRRLEAKKGRTAFRLGVLVLIVSSLANALPPLQRDPDKLAWAVTALAKISSAVERGEPYRFFTATLVHGDFAGLLVGFLVFVAVAPLLEKLLGGSWLFVAFAGGGFVATVASFVFAPGRAYMGLTGATAAIAGLLLFLGVRERTRLPPATLRRIASRVAVVLVILAFASALLPYADVAAHLGGFTFGAGLALFARPKPEVREAMERARSEALHTPS